MSEHQSEEFQQIEKLYEFSERLNASKDKSQVRYPHFFPTRGFEIERSLFLLWIRIRVILKWIPAFVFSLKLSSLLFGFLSF